MLRLIFILINFCLLSVSFAAEVQNLYQSQALVNSKAPEDRALLAPKLLKNVLLKVVGDARLVDAMDLSAIEAQNLIQQYSYSTANPLDFDLTQPEQLSLVLNFDPNAVNALVEQEGLPVWGTLRPNVLVWYMPDPYTVTGLETGPVEAIRGLTAAAKSRGLPLIIPFMDDRDQSAINADALIYGDISAIQKASLRYQPDVIVTVKQASSSANELNWSRLQGDEVKTWTSSGDASSAIKTGIGALVDQLARTYSQVVVTGSVGNTLNVKISNVTSFQDLTKIKNYLSKIDLITEVNVVDIHPQQVDLNMRFNGEQYILERKLALGNLLIEEDKANEPGTLLYRLAP